MLFDEMLLSKFLYKFEPPFNGDTEGALRAVLEIASKLNSNGVPSGMEIPLTAPILRAYPALSAFASANPSWGKSIILPNAAGIVIASARTGEVVQTGAQGGSSGDGDEGSGGQGGGAGASGDNGSEESPESRSSGQGDAQSGDGDDGGKPPQPSQGGDNGDGDEGDESGDPSQGGDEGDNGDGEGDGEGEGEGEGEGDDQQPNGDNPDVPPPPPLTQEEEAPPPPKKRAPRTTEGKIIARIESGFENIWLYGPAGCGKTTVCREAAKKLKLPCFVLSCCKDTDPAQIRGKIYPEAQESELIKFYEQPSIIVLDEFTSCEDATAMLLNSALANGEILAATGRQVKRHPKCVIIATSNTTGQGGDELYCGNNRLDASTLDRFAGGFIEVKYSTTYEKKYDAECYEFVLKLRKLCEQKSLQRIVSTRLLQACCKLKQAGMDFRKESIADWTKDERAIVARSIEHVIVSPEDDEEWEP